MHCPVGPSLTENVAGVPTNVDESVEVTRGAVVEVALPSLVLLDYAVPAFDALCVPELAAFVPDVIFIFYLDGVCNVEAHRHIHALVERIGDVIVVVGAVVI
jgi:hypothetical protein